MTQREVSVAIQGELGSNHDLAAGYYFGEGYRPRFCSTFDEVFESAGAGETDFGLAAVENTLVGPIIPTYDLLREHAGREAGVLVVGEIFLGIHHSLIGLPDARIEDIRTVLSHPAALGQCRQFLQRELLEATTRETHDTAASADLIKEMGDPTVAAIAGPHNAERLGLSLLRTEIADRSRNLTRFLVLQGLGQAVPDTSAAPNKTSLLIERLNRGPDDSAPGTLWSALGCFAVNGVSLTKIEQRPDPGRPWRYAFFVDCAAGVEDASMRASLDALDRLGAEWRSLGSYQAGRTYDD